MLIFYQTDKRSGITLPLLKLTERTTGMVNFCFTVDGKKPSILKGRDQGTNMRYQKSTIVTFKLAIAPASLAFLLTGCGPEASTTPLDTGVYPAIQAAADCTKARVSPPTVTAAQVGSFVQLAQTCSGMIGDPNRSNTDEANAALNAARIYLPVARATSDSAQAHQYLTSALGLAQQSRELLSDADIARNAELKTSLGGDNYLFERVKLVASSQFELGRSASTSTTFAECGDRAQCLRAGLSTLQRENAILSVASGASKERQRLSYYQLIYDWAQADRQLADMEGTTNVDAAIQNLSRITNDTQITALPQGASLVSRARSLLVTTALSTGQRLISPPASQNAPAPTRQDINRAISFFNSADQAAMGQAGLQAEQASAKIGLGDANLMRAMELAGSDMRGAANDLCAAATAYGAAASGPVGASGEVGYRSREGRGASLYELSVLEASACPTENGRGEQLQARRVAQAISEFNAARAMRSAASVPFDRAQSATLADLYAIDGQCDQAISVINDNNISGTPSTADVRAEASTLLFCINETDGSNAEKVQLLTNAVSKFPTLPEVQIALGAVQFDDKNWAAAANAFMRADQLATGKAEFSADQAEALYFRSATETASALTQGRTPSPTAMAWANQSIILGGNQIDYLHQACKAHLILASTNADRANRDRYCNADLATLDGALLKAMNDYKLAQRSQQYTLAFQSTSDEFQSLAVRFGAEAIAGTLDWPELTQPATYQRVADFGRIAARRCGTVAGVAAQPLPNDATARGFFRSFTAFNCQ